MRRQLRRGRLMGAFQQQSLQQAGLITNAGGEAGAFGNGKGKAVAPHNQGATPLHSAHNPFLRQGCKRAAHRVAINLKLCRQRSADAIQHTLRHALGELRCADIMSRPPMAVEPGVTLKEAWAMMRREQIKALPVVDAQGMVLGIVTVADFMRLANLELHEGLGRRLRQLVKGRTGQPSRVEDIMIRQVQVAHAQQHVMELVPLFSRGGHHHIPIVDAQGRLAGVITQSDLVRALATALPVPEGEGACAS